MATVQWSDALCLDLDFMDDTHREFIDLLAEVEVADDDRVVACFAAMVEHTDGHFGAEDRWMQDTHFSSSNCHSMQHNVILQVLREGLKRGQAGDLVLLRDLARELDVWFSQHAQTMDAALALHLRGVGYDADSGRVLHPEALPAQEISGCGGSCSS
ncbi:MAG: hemerythrin domain-containing protein [Alphaproteobacteria bacterium]|nr:hemerythrin domain-containing protein [Alphaproteobacteria bacterium]